MINFQINVTIAKDFIVGAGGQYFLDSTVGSYFLILFSILGTHFPMIQEAFIWNTSSSFLMPGG